MKTDYIQALPEAERRFFSAEVRMEKRAEGDDTAVIEGYAALFNSVTNIGGWFREEILPGAFDEVLQDDIRCLFNHDPNQILARTTAGTLEVFVDQKGFGYRYTTPDVSYAKDLATNISLGNVTQSSFAFRAKETIWIDVEGEPSLRQIKKMERVYDVSPVTYPAYQDTSVAKRSYDAFLQENNDIVTRSDGENNKGLSLVEAQLLINENLI